MLLGNLGADPELRVTGNGQSLLKLRLATSESYLDRNKVRQERTEWHSVVVWGKRADGLSKFLTKGMRLFIEGGLRTSSYEAPDGTKRYRTEVVANNVIVAGSAPAGQRSDSKSQSSDDYDYGGASSGDDDIPF
jgi:single-strand DNA-binding protein